MKKCKKKKKEKANAILSGVDPVDQVTVRQNFLSFSALHENPILKDSQISVYRLPNRPTECFRHHSGM